MNLNQLQKDFREEVLKYKPGLIGFSVLEITYDQGLELAKAIEDLFIPVLFGGIYPTFAPKIVLREKCINMMNFTPYYLTTNNTIQMNMNLPN